MARSRLPFTLCMLGSCHRERASSTVNQFPSCMPSFFAPFTRPMTAASSGLRSPVSAASRQVGGLPPVLQVKGATVVQAIAVYGKLNVQGQLTERRETVNLNELFERMIVEEKEAYAKEGKLPNWFTQTTGNQVATAPHESQGDGDGVVARNAGSALLGPQGEGDFALQKRSWRKLMEMTLRSGDLMEPMSVAQKAIEQAYRIQQRLRVWRPKRAAVLGASTLGLLSSLVLRLRGLEVTAFENRCHRS
jgi:glucose dehydrogenase-like enzyme